VIGYAGTTVVSSGAGLPLGPAWVLHQILPDLLRWNVVLLVLNLVPLYPLDGGRIFLNATWGILQSRGVFEAYGRAVRAAVWAARVSGVGGILYGLQTGNTLLLLMFAWFWYTAEQLQRDRGF